MVMLLCSCGLYSYPYIYAPSLSGGAASSGRPNVTIIHNGDNDPNVFKGYELYYRFYNYVTAETEHSKDDKAIFSTKEPDYSALVAAGYTRCRTVKLIKTDTKYPMFPVPVDYRDDDFQMYIDFKPITTSASKEEMGIETEYAWSPFYRAIKDQDPDTGERELAGGKPDDDIYKDFNSDDLQYDEYHDSDLPSADISVSFYIIGYGQHENHNLYSKPVWLGVVHCWK